jgi:hypothetical protein
MIKLLIVVMLLIAAALLGGAYLHFNPGFLILAILGFGIYWAGRIGGPTLPPGSNRSSHWGIYFDRDDVWVTGSDTDDDSNDDHGARR